MSVDEICNHGPYTLAAIVCAQPLKRMFFTNMKHIIIKKHILFIFIGLAFLGCSSDDSTENILVLYNQTYCGDPWGSTENNNELIDIVRNYFKSVNIEISNVKIDNKGTPQLCNACNCLSGKRIIAEVSIHDLDSIKKYGFQENE